MITLSKKLVIVFQPLGQMVPEQPPEGIQWCDFKKKSIETIHGICKEGVLPHHQGQAYPLYFDCDAGGADHSIWLCPQQ